MNTAHEQPLCLTTRFAAFLSYSSKDQAIAKRLHSEMEAIRLPNAMHASGRRRLGPLCLDRSDFSASPSLEKEIIRALEDSAYLIVLCSPAAAQSPWVNKEIETFRAMGGGDRILAIIASGRPEMWSAEKPEGAFPPALVANGPDVPLAADLTQASRTVTTEALRLASHMLAVRYDDLYDRYRRDQKRRRVFWASAAAVVLATAGFGIRTVLVERERATEQARIAADENRKAVLSDARKLAGDALRAYRDGELDMALALAVRSLRTAETPEGNRAGQEILAENRFFVAPKIVARTRSSPYPIHLVPETESIAFVDPDRLEPDKWVKVVDFSGDVRRDFELAPGSLAVVDDTVVFANGGSGVHSEVLSKTEIQQVKANDFREIEKGTFGRYAAWIEADPTYEPYRPEQRPAYASKLVIVDRIGSGETWDVELPAELADVSVFGLIQRGSTFLVGVRKADNSSTLLSLRVEGGNLRIERHAEIANPGSRQFIKLLNASEGVGVLIANDGVLLFDLDGQDLRIEPAALGRPDPSMIIRDADFNPTRNEIRLLSERPRIEPNGELRIELGVQSSNLDSIRFLDGHTEDRPRWVGSQRLAVTTDDGTTIFDVGTGGLGALNHVARGEVNVCGSEPQSLPVIGVYSPATSMAEFLAGIGSDCLPQTWLDVLDALASGYCYVAAIAPHPDEPLIALRWSSCGSTESGQVTVHDRESGELRRSIRFTPPADLDLGFPLIGSQDGRIHVTTSGRFVAPGGEIGVLLRLPEKHFAPAEEVVEKGIPLLSTSMMGAELKMVDGRYAFDEPGGFIMMDPKTLKTERVQNVSAANCYGSHDAGSGRNVGVDGGSICLSVIGADAKLQLDGLVAFHPHKVAAQPGGAALAILGRLGERTALSVVEVSLPEGPPLIEHLTKLFTSRISEGAAFLDPAQPLPQ